jgi:hypothetical protein
VPACAEEDLAVDIDCFTLIWLYDRKAIDFPDPRTQRCLTVLELTKMNERRPMGSNTLSDSLLIRRTLLSNIVNLNNSASQTEDSFFSQ